MPVPTMLTETVAGLVQPAARVLLPLNPGAALTMVTAGALPVPVQVRLTVMWLLLTMLNPVSVTLLVVLTALKPSLVPVLFCS